MNDIQKIINNKAEKVVDDKLHKFFLMIRDANLFDEKIISRVFIQIEGETKNIREAMWSENTTLGRLIKQQLLPKEIEKQSKLFVEEVNRLSKEIDELKDFTQI